MRHDEHSAAAERRLGAVTPGRHELQQLGEKEDKTPEDWARISELKLQISLAYAGAGVHAQLALHGILTELAHTLGPTLARAAAVHLAEDVAWPRPERAGMSPDERRRAAQRDAAPQG